MEGTITDHLSLYGLERLLSKERHGTAQLHAHLAACHYCRRRYEAMELENEILLSAVEVLPSFTRLLREHRGAKRPVVGPGSSVLPQPSYGFACTPSGKKSGESA